LTSFTGTLPLWRKASDMPKSQSYSGAIGVKNKDGFRYWGTIWGTGNLHFSKVPLSEAPDTAATCSASHPQVFPVTGTSAPVTADASSDSKKPTTRAISSAFTQ
jgi:hypothetical protein